MSSLVHAKYDETSAKNQLLDPNELGRAVTFNGSSLVSGDGNSYALGPPSIGLDASVLTDCIFGQLPDGRFVGMGDLDNSSDSRLWISTGYNSGTITRMNATSTFVQSGGLQDTAGAEWSGDR